MDKINNEVTNNPSWYKTRFGKPLERAFLRFFTNMKFSKENISISRIKLNLEKIKLLIPIIG